jgi:hypothetical protein
MLEDEGRVTSSAHKTQGVLGRSEWIIERRYDPKKLNLTDKQYRKLEGRGNAMRNTAMEELQTTIITKTARYQRDDGRVWRASSAAESKVPSQPDVRVRGPIRNRREKRLHLVVRNGICGSGHKVPLLKNKELLYSVDPCRDKLQAARQVIETGEGE